MKKSKSKIGADLDLTADGLHSAAIHLLRRVRHADSATGLGPARLSALSVLVFGGPMALKQLAAAEQVKPPTMSRIVGALERAGLVEIVADDADARRILIRPTRRGTELLHAGRKRRVATLSARLHGLKPYELKTLQNAVAILERLNRSWAETSDCRKRHRQAPSS